MTDSTSNIWIFNHYADGPDGQATRDYDRGRELVARGHQVTVFSSSFSQFKLRDDKLAPGQSYRIEVYNGVRFVWVKTVPYKRNNWRRALNMAGFAIRAYWIGRRMNERPEVIIGTSVHPLTPLAAYFLARNKGARFFFEVTDLWPQTLVDMGVISKWSPITLGLRWLEKFLYRRAETILTVLPYAEEYIRNLGISKKKVTWIPNGVDLRYFENMKPYEGGESNRFTVMYLGGHAQHLGLDVILNAAKILLDDDVSSVRFVMVGDGMEKPRLMQRAQELGLRNLEFHDAVPKSKIYKVMEEADALICHFKDLPLLRYGTSMFKVFDYLASGRPIIYAVNGRNNPVEEAQAGITIPPEDANAMANAIRSLSALSREERVKMGKNGYAFVKANYDTRVHAVHLEQVLQPPL